MSVRVYIRTLPGRGYEAWGEDFVEERLAKSLAAVETQVHVQIIEGRPLTYTDVHGEHFIIPTSAIECVTIREQQD